MRAVWTDILDVTGLLLLAAGLAVGFWPMLQGFALCLAAVVILTGSYVSARLAAR